MTTKKRYTNIKIVKIMKNTNQMPEENKVTAI